MGRNYQTLACACGCGRTRRDYDGALAWTCAACNEECALNATILARLNKPAPQHASLRGIPAINATQVRVSEPWKGWDVKGRKTTLKTSAPVEVREQRDDRKLMSKWGTIHNPND